MVRCRWLVLQQCRSSGPLFSFEAYNVATTLHSIVMIAANSLMTGLILIKNPKRLDKMKGRLMVAFQRLTRSDAPPATILIRILVGAVFFSEGIQKFLFSDALGVGRFEKIGIPRSEERRVGKE